LLSVSVFRAPLHQRKEGGNSLQHREISRRYALMEDGTQTVHQHVHNTAATVTGPRQPPFRQFP
jgi:hypothetical protein